MVQPWQGGRRPEMDHYHCGACVTCVTERRTVAVQMQDELWAIGVGAVASLDPSFPGPLSGILGAATREVTHERQKFCACGGLASLLRWPA